MIAHFKIFYKQPITNDLGVATIYPKTHLRTHFNRKYGNSLHLYPSSDGFLMIRIQNVCEKAILTCLIPILVGFIMSLSALFRPSLSV